MKAIGLNRRGFFQSLLLGAAGLSLPRIVAAGPSRKPNFVVVLADDLGWRGLGCFASKYYGTPNLDRLCAESMKFTDGYTTARFGKWHLGPSHPSEHGFDVAIESSGRHFDPQTKAPADMPKGTYLTDLLADRALEFIEQNKDRPFFLYFPDFLVHKPHEAKEELIEDRPELYDLESDIGEKHNLAQTMPAKVEELGAKLKAWMKAVGAPNLPQNPSYNPEGSKQ